MVIRGLHADPQHLECIVTFTFARYGGDVNFRAPCHRFATLAVYTYAGSEACLDRGSIQVVSKHGRGPFPFQMEVSTPNPLWLNELTPYQSAGQL